MALIHRRQDKLSCSLVSNVSGKSSTFLLYDDSKPKIASETAGGFMVMGSLNLSYTSMLQTFTTESWIYVFSNTEKFEGQLFVDEDETD